MHDGSTKPPAPDTARAVAMMQRNSATPYMVADGISHDEILLTPEGDFVFGGMIVDLKRSRFK